MASGTANGSSISVTNTKKERATARWTILRNALLQHHESGDSSISQHSIHRFPGYQLLHPAILKKEDLHRFDRLKTFCWDDRLDMSENLNRLEIHVLSLACCSPKGSCMEIQDCPPKTDLSWLDTLKTRCSPCTLVMLVEKDKCPTSVTVLVQQGSGTQFAACRYKLDETCSLWTREPQTTKLSLSDLVSHRTVGVDNTGNICVWDSERTLAYLLYHHLHEFPIQVRSSRRLLELGTGMAGLAAVALGLRIVQEDAAAKISILLTDGNAVGVRNNCINQHLTSTCSSHANDPSHPYLQLDISSRVLLWTTNMEAPPQEELQELILVSDCTHFQQFHAALAVTTLRMLRVGGIAIFCQPERSDSLSNFCDLLRSPGLKSDLVSVASWTHQVLSEMKAKAKKDSTTVFDENLHHPMVLIVTKLRDLNTQDCETLNYHKQKAQRRRLK